MIWDERRTYNRLGNMLIVAQQYGMRAPFTWYLPPEAIRAFLAGWVAQAQRNPYTAQELHRAREHIFADGARLLGHLVLQAQPSVDVAAMLVEEVKQPGERHRMAVLLAPDGVTNSHSYFFEDEHEGADASGFYADHMERIRQRWEQTIMEKFNETTGFGFTRHDRPKSPGGWGSPNP